MSEQEGDEPIDEDGPGVLRRAEQIPRDGEFPPFRSLLSHPRLNEGTTFALHPVREFRSGGLPPHDRAAERSN